MEVVQRPIESIRPYANNPRKNDKAVDAAAKSISEFDWNQPIVVDAEGVIIAGDTRYKAALKLGLKTVPVFVAAHLSEEDARRYRIADNKVGEIAGWDYDRLIEELKADGGDPRSWLDLGFNEGELEELLVVPGQTDPNAVPEPSEIVTAELGDLWVLGDHRLLCGDSTEIDDVRRLMDGDVADLCATDPPYLVDYTGKRPAASGKDWTASYIEVGKEGGAAFYLDVFANAMEVMSQSCAVYCWHAHPWTKVIEAAWVEVGILPHQTIIWTKPTCLMGHTMWLMRHEICLMGWRKGTRPRAHVWANGDSVWGDDATVGDLEDMTREQLIEIIQRQTDIWRMDWEGKARIVGNEHPTQKPVETFTKPIHRHTVPGDVLYEPFSGSGSQIIAGQMTGRCVRAMELSPPFVDAGIRRWQNFTGLEAVHEVSGRTWAEERKRRRASEKRRSRQKAG